MLRLPTTSICNAFSAQVRRYTGNGGGQGSIRSGGGSFGKRERAQEEQYYRKKEADELKKLKEDMEKKDSNPKAK